MGGYIFVDLICQVFTMYLFCGLNQKIPNEISHVFSVISLAVYNRYFTLKRVVWYSEEGGVVL